MRRREVRFVADSNRLFRLWRGEVPHIGRVRTADDAKRAVAAYTKLRPGIGIVTPVKLEFIGGARDEDELQVMDVFLNEFVLADGGDVRAEDWTRAEQLARRVPEDGRPRGAMDCLIVAVCKRLRLELMSDDTGLPR